MFSQVVDFVPRYEFDRIVAMFNGNYHARELSCYNQFLHLLFGQLTGCSSLREICLCLEAHRCSIPAFIHVTDRRCHDRKLIDMIVPVPFTFYVMDKAYVDFASFARFDAAEAYFVTRAKDNMRYEVEERNYNIDESCGLLGDSAVRLTGVKTARLYPNPLRLVEYRDSDNGEMLRFITNNFDISALEVANIYRNRWQIEVFFKWIKQNIVIKTLWGYSENAVKTHLWVAICAYLIVARIKATYDTPYSITEILSILHVSALEKANLKELLSRPETLIQNHNVNEPNLFD